MSHVYIMLVFFVTTTTSFDILIQLLLAQGTGFSNEE